MKKALITGAAGGLGRAACQLFLQNGYDVWGIDLKEKEPLPGLRFIAADLTDPHSVADALKTVSAETAKLDVILHTAGFYNLDSLVEIGEEDFHRIFEVNLFAAARVNRVFLPLLGENSRILITTSELAPLDPLPFTGIYAITKTSLEKYAYSLRMELQLLGIHVSVIRPGAIRTELLKTSTDALSRFCDNTKLYACNAQRFKHIVDSVEARNIPPERVSALALRAAESKHPKYIYCINRNPLLLLLNLLPQKLQTQIIGRILKP